MSRPQRPGRGARRLGKVVLLALALTHAVADATLPAPVRAALRQAGMTGHDVSAIVLPLDKPEAAARLTHHPDVPRNPASVMKLVTTWAGLQLLGPDHLWQTRIYTTGPMREGVLSGDLVIQGSGDPKLVVERAQSLLAQVHEAGVRDVRGDIVLDRSVFEPEARDTPFDDEPLRPYNVSPDGLLMNFGSLVYRFTPDPAVGRARVRSEPPLEGLETPADVSLQSGACEDWRSQLQADFSQALRPRFTGSYPQSCGERPWPVAYADSNGFAPRMVQALWREAGGHLSGQVRWGARPGQARLLLEYPSLPLRDLIADINKFSNNVMAQQLFLTLSSELGAPGRFEASRLRLTQWWRKQFPGQPLPVLDNGSGLSRSERSTVAALAALLRQARHAPHADVFMRSLAVAGVDGTVSRLRERLPDSPVLGQAWLKTGSLRDVASVAGYVQGQSGRMYAVVAIVNHPQAAQARRALDLLLDWTARDLDSTRSFSAARP